MGGPGHDEEFESLLSTIVERHARASRLRDAGELAEQVLSDALRVGDAVRRSVRAGAARPDAEDCAALARLAGTLDAALARATAKEPMAALRAAILARRGGDAARLATRVFLDLAPPRHLPPVVYRAVAARRRAARGEALVHPDDLAQEIAAVSRAGIVPATPEPEHPPEALVVSPSFAACGSEIALARGTEDLGATLLEETISGDLLSFTALPGPFGVALAGAADDEWWAASPIGYASYRARLRAALERLGIEVELAA